MGSYQLLQMGRRNKSNRVCDWTHDVTFLAFIHFNTVWWKRKWLAFDDVIDAPFVLCPMLNHCPDAVTPEMPSIESIKIYTDFHNYLTITTISVRNIAHSRISRVHRYLQMFYRFWKFKLLSKWIFFSCMPLADVCWLWWFWLINFVFDWNSDGTDENRSELMKRPNSFLLSPPPFQRINVHHHHHFL